MGFNHMFVLLVLVGCGCVTNGAQNDGNNLTKQPTRCLTPPSAPKQIETVISQCQDDVKQSIVTEALQYLQSQRQHIRSKRQTQQSFHGAFGIPTPVAVADQNGGNSKQNGGNVPFLSESPTLSGDDRRIAGCLLQCVYKKVGAVDAAGWPTLNGLVALYSAGVGEHGYFMATLRATATCMQGAHNNLRLSRDANSSGQRCDMAYDMFDCISDRLTEYCRGGNI